MIVRDGDKKNKIVSKDSGSGVVREIEHGGIAHIEIIIIVHFFIVLRHVLKEETK